MIYSKRAFTLIELLLVIAIILLVSVPTAAFSTSFIHQISVRDSSEALIGMLREAQILSMLGKEDSVWGVKKQEENLILFRGNDFSSRDYSFDQTVKINNNVNVVGFDEVSFSRYEGLPAMVLPSVSIVWGNMSESFSLNAEGIVE